MHKPLGLSAGNWQFNGVPSQAYRKGSAHAYLHMCTRNINVRPTHSGRGSGIASAWLNLHVLTECMTRAANIFKRIQVVPDGFHFQILLLLHGIARTREWQPHNERIMNQV